MVARMIQPSLTFCYEAFVEIGARQPLGSNALGERFIVPIVGGHFQGERLRGLVRPGGADRQWLRPDGVKTLDALYDMETDDGCVITVRNRVVIDESPAQGRYARSVISLQAMSADYDWLNRRVYVGTLQGLQPSHNAVLIRCYTLE